MPGQNPPPRGGFCPGTVLCRVAVYEKDGGGVGIAKMNTGLMAKMFGGTVAEVMGGAVAVEELEILEGIIAE